MAKGPVPLHERTPAPWPRVPWPKDLCQQSAHSTLQKQGPSAGPCTQLETYISCTTGKKRYYT